MVGKIDKGFGLRSHLIPFCRAEGVAAAVLEHSPRNEDGEGALRRMPYDCISCWEVMEEFIRDPANRDVLAFEHVFQASSWKHRGNPLWDKGVDRHVELRQGKR
jgi:hypothetical protein